jgi:hypothetical protein
MLDVMEKSILQMLINAGIMRDEDLMMQLELLKKSLTTSSANSNNKTLTEVFKNINANLRHLSLEIRSVIIVPTANTSSRRSSSSSSVGTSGSSIREVYHGLVNSEEDFVAKDYGSEFDPIELKYFSEMIYKIMAAHYLSSTDILGFKPAKYNEYQATTFLHRLESLGWLQRNDSNYLVLGSRSYLELHTFLSNIITNSEDLDGLAEDAKEARRNELRQQVLKLPQLLNY